MKVTSVSAEETTSLTEAKVGLALHNINQMFQKLSAGLNANAFLNGLFHQILPFFSYIVHFDHFGAFWHILANLAILAYFGNRPKAGLLAGWA